jgi:Integrase core domain
MPYQAPNANAHAERFVRSIRGECLDRLILFGERRLLRVLKELVVHYHNERHHQGLGNDLIAAPSAVSRAGIRYHDRLGGPLPYYYHAARAWDEFSDSTGSIIDCKLEGCSRPVRVRPPFRLCSSCLQANLLVSMRRRCPECSSDDRSIALVAGLVQPSPYERRRSAMRMHRALLLAAVFALSSLDGVAGEKQIVDVKELVGSWRGWVTGEFGQERATMIVSADGSYKASTTRGSTTEGKFYLEDGKLRYRSSRTTGTASLSEDRGKAVLTVMPEDPNYQTGRGEYERVE